MSEDRPLEDPAQAIGRLENTLRDLESTLLARMSKRPTGDIEETIRTTPKPGTLICNGDLVSRTTYAALWAWVQANNRVQPGLFTNGDGTTTFGLPDWRGKVMRGTPNGEAVGLLTGADTKTIATAQLPAHGHTGSTSSAGTHNHSGSTSSSGSHNGHNSGSTNVASALPGSQDFFFSVASSTQNANGSHSHGMDLDDGGSHTHPVTVNNTGGGEAFDVRQASFNGNWLVWC